MGELRKSLTKTEEILYVCAQVQLVLLKKKRGHARARVGARIIQEREKRSGEGDAVSKSEETPPAHERKKKETAQRRATHTRAGTATKRVGHLEALEAVAVLGLLADDIEDGIHQLGTLGVVTCTEGQGAGKHNGERARNLCGMGAKTSEPSM